MPVSLLLKRVRRVQQPSLTEMGAHDLQSNRQSTYEPTRNRHRRQAREVRSAGVDVVQVHGDGIGWLVSDWKRRCRRRRPHQNIDLSGSALEISRNQLPYLLRLQVIGIVVTG